MALCLEVDRGGPNYAKTIWDDVELRRAVDINFSRGQSLASCFDGTPKIHVMRKKPPASTWLRIDAIVLAIGRLKKIIERYADDAIEFIPVETFLRENERSEPVPWPDDDQFFMINPMNIVDCIDEKKSIFSRKEFMNNNIIYFGFEFMYLLEDKTQGLNIFRVLGTESRVFMSEELARELNKSGSLGAGWIPPEELHRPPELFPKLWLGRQRRSDRI